MAAKKSKKRRGQHRIKTVDHTAKRDLDLFIENTGELYPMKQAIIANLQKKKAKGKYDKTKAPKAWQYFVDRGAKQYVKENGVTSPTFDKTTRTALAEDLAKRYENGED